MNYKMIIQWLKLKKKKIGTYKEVCFVNRKRVFKFRFNKESLHLKTEF